MLASFSLSSYRAVSPSLKWKLTSFSRTFCCFWAGVMPFSFLALYPSTYCTAHKKEAWRHKVEGWKCGFRTVFRCWNKWKRTSTSTDMVLRTGEARTLREGDGRGGRAPGRGEDYDGRQKVWFYIHCDPPGRPTINPITSVWSQLPTCLSISEPIRLFKGGRSL